MKKFAFITISLKTQSGINKTYQAKCKALRKLGLSNFHFYILNPNYEYKNGILNYIRINKSDTIKYIYQRYNIIKKYVPVDKYDVLSIRFNSLDVSSLSFVNDYKVVSEHHTKAYFERKLKIKCFFNEKDRKYNKLFFDCYSLGLDCLFEKNYLKKISGIIGISNEVVLYEKRKINNDIPSIVIPNGTNVESIAQSGFKKFNGKTINLVFVANKLNPWHGLDRLLTSINRYNGKINIVLNLVGDFEVSESLISNKNVKLIHWGLVDQSQLINVFSKSNVGVSSLGLYRNDMTEGSPLKTAEYCASGIPFIYAYETSDFDNVKNSYKFCLKLDNNSSEIDFDNIINFANEVSQKKDISDYMRNYAFHQFDWTIKMKQYYEFMKSLD